MVECYVGTSGWSYLHWKGILYPEGLPQKSWLNYYSQYFNCVEVNSTFYRNFAPSTFKNWAKSVPESFRFIFKIPQEISHKKRLIDVRADLNNFFSSLELIKSKIGCLLLQLPPSFFIELDKFEEAIAFATESFPIAVEFRNNFWLFDGVDEILKKYKCIFVNPDSPKNPFQTVLTTNKLYIRLHGRTSLHKSSYTEQELQEIVSTIEEFDNEIDEAWIIFNNGVYGHAITNAMRLIELLSQKPKTIKFEHRCNPQLGL